MAREIESAHQREQQSHKYGLTTETTVIRCDDGAVYEFAKAEDEPNARLTRRFQPSGKMSTSSGVLPESVKQLAEDLFGENKWRK